MRAIAEYGIRYQQAKASRFRYNASTNKDGLLKLDLPELDEMDAVFSFKENFQGSKKDMAKWVDKYKRSDEAYLVRDDEEDKRAEKRRRSKKREHHINIRANLSVVTNMSNISEISANSTGVSDITRESEPSIDHSMDEALNDTHRFLAQQRAQQQCVPDRQQASRNAYLKRTNKHLADSKDSDTPIGEEPKATSSPKRQKYIQPSNDIPRYNRYEIAMNSSHRSETVESYRRTWSQSKPNISITGGMANRLGSKSAFETQNLSAQSPAATHQQSSQNAMITDPDLVKQVGDTQI